MCFIVGLKNGPKCELSQSHNYATSFFSLLFHPHYVGVQQGSSDKRRYLASVCLYMFNCLPWSPTDTPFPIEIWLPLSLVRWFQIH